MAAGRGDRGQGASGGLCALGLLRILGARTLLVLSARETTAALAVVATLPVVRGARAAALERVIVDDHAAAVAGLAVLREDLEQAGAHALAGHLHEPQRGDLGDLVLGAVATQALDQAPQHEVAVGLEHHVDEVDDHDAADIAQAQLPHDLLGRLEVVLGDGLLEIAAGAGELARVDVDDGHGLGAVDHQGAARGQHDLALQCLEDLIVHPVVGEEILVPVPAVDAVQQVRSHVGHVGLDAVPGLLALDVHGGEVLVEDVAHGLDGQIRLGVQQLRRKRLALGRLLLDLLPLGAQAVDVVGQLLLRSPLGGGAHDDARTLREVVLEDLLQPLALDVGQLAGDAGHRAAGHEHEVAPRQGDLAGQARALVPHRVLGGLHQHRVSGLQRILDALGRTVEARLVPVDLAGVEDGVAAAADVHEGGLHGRQHVLDLAQVDAADQRVLLGVRDEVLREDPVLEHADLDAVVLLPHHHGPLDRFPTSQELRLGDHLAAAPGLTRLATTLLLGLQARGALDRLHSGGRGAVDHARGADARDGLLRVAVVPADQLQILRAATAPAPTSARDPSTGLRVLVLGLLGLLLLLHLAQTSLLALALGALPCRGDVLRGRGVEEQRRGRRRAERGERIRRRLLVLGLLVLALLRRLLLGRLLLALRLLGLLAAAQRRGAQDRGAGLLLRVLCGLERLEGGLRRICLLGGLALGLDALALLLGLLVLRRLRLLALARLGPRFDLLDPVLLGLGRRRRSGLGRRRLGCRRGLLSRSRDVDLGLRRLRVGCGGGALRRDVRALRRGVRLGLCLL